MAEAREVDPAEAVWTVPGGRMKAGRRHRVPLSDGARHVLETSRLPSSSGLLFPSPRGSVMSDSTLSKMLRQLGIRAVPHGFRSSFRDWAAEEAAAPRELAELALAHMPRTPGPTCLSRGAASCRRGAPIWTSAARSSPAGEGRRESVEIPTAARYGEDGSGGTL